MNKKASSILIVIGEVMLVILFGFMIMRNATNLATSDHIQKVNLAQDMFLMINTLVGTPGEAVVAYPTSTEKFILILSKDSVIVMAPKDLPTDQEKRIFRLPEGWTAEGVTKQLKKVCLEKKSNKIWLRECKENE
ncbi:MAG: hypothetical protein AABX04_00820 [Nanoarchaeota archaeon]